MWHNTMATDLFQIADAVHDEKSFLDFVEALRADWENEMKVGSKTPSSPYSAGENGWENGEVGAFLDAAASWGKSSIHGLATYTQPENPWRRAAHILHAGKFYE